MLECDGQPLCPAWRRFQQDQSPLDNNGRFLLYSEPWRATPVDADKSKPGSEGAHTFLLLLPDGLSPFRPLVVRGDEEGVALSETEEERRINLITP